MSKMLSKMNLISVVQQLPEEDIETIQGYVEMIEEENQELKQQQKEFIKYLEKKINISRNTEPFFVEHIHGSYDLTELELNMLKEILQKYKEIIGGKNEKQ